MHHNYNKLTCTVEYGSGVNPSNSIGTYNPFRYRGYFYDSENGLYYLMSRYYDPEIGRWLNSDDIGFLNPIKSNGLNLYAYCFNNPIYYIDKIGNKPEVNVGIDIWSLINRNGWVWRSHRREPKRNLIIDKNNPFKYFGNNLAYMGEELLSIFEARVLTWSLKFCSMSSTGFTLLSAGIDVFDGRMYLNDSDYLGIKVGSASAKIGVDWGDDFLISFEMKATALLWGIFRICRCRNTIWFSKFYLKI